MIEPQLYVRCVKCGGVPNWTSEQAEEKEGKKTIHYKLEGNCPLCGGGEFHLVEVKVPNASNKD